MKYPRIYSLSTVGLLKHYNQDYLIHPERTDFTGSNGVGKSIIADILQLIFISDDKLIEFGTDGLKKELRQIYTLPLNINEGYAFLNIEIQENLFVTIGVSIPNSKSKRIKPFVILKDTDLNKNIADLMFSREQLPTSKDFIKENKFLAMDELSKHVRSKLSLYLRHFTYKEEKDEYYAFLYNKEILPINLSIENNLKAFAKIIQSFSKAKSLGLKSSKSLQEFLFEDSEKEYEQSFSLHKAHLEKLVNDFKRLEAFIKDLESKQEALSRLKSIEDLKKPAQEAYLKTDVLFAFQQMQEAINLLTAQREELNKFEAEEKELIAKIPKLKAVNIKTEETVSNCKSGLDNLKEYKTLLNQIADIRIEIKNILDANAPEIVEPISIELEIAEFSTSEIVKRINEFRFLFEKYKSVAAIKEKVSAQKNAIEQHKQSVAKEIDSIQELIGLMDLNKKNTLFSKALENAKELSEGQEAVLFELMNVHWDKPVNPKTGDRFTLSASLLDEENIEENSSSNGYWLKSGDLNLFIPKLNRKQLFDDPNRLKQAIESRKQELTATLNNKRAELREIDKFEQGILFEDSKITLNYALDQNLKDYTAYQKYEKTAKIIQNIGKKIEGLESGIKTLELEMAGLRSSLKFNTENLDIGTLIKEEENRLAIKEKRAKNISAALVKCETHYKTLTETIIPGKDKQVTQTREEAEKKRSVFTNKDSQAKDQIPGIDVELNTRDLIDEERVKNLEGVYRSSKENYITEFKSIVARFEETTGRKNSEINEQIDSQVYIFQILEKILLGPKIKYLDSIADELREANRSRLIMAEAIHETMLKIFIHTKNKYEEYRTIIRDLNTFFKGKKISGNYYFQVDFVPHKEFKIDWINSLQGQSQTVYKQGELPFGDAVESFVEEFFKKANNYRKRVRFLDLLDPKSYFILETSLTDENKNEISGSTGETYAAIVLLGIGRLSKVQSSDRKGIKFIILEETANLDNTNFSTFPDIAEEFGYQLFTMTPKPYGSDSDKGWYVHHLIRGIDDIKINYPVPASYFKTNQNKVDLKNYLETLNKE
jgi:exonuclease SbcC